MPINKAKRDVFWFNQNDCLYPILIKELDAAIKKGYSVIELSRILDLSGARNLYALLRNSGLIPRMDQRRGKAFNLPVLFTKVLQYTQLGYLQWCNCHALDPSATAQALAAPVNHGDSSSLAAHRALRKDFPHAYRKMLDNDVEISTSSVPKSERLRTDYSMTIRLDKTTYKYVAFVHELPECQVEAATRDHAFRLLRAKYVIFASINKLQLLPRRELEAL